MAARTRIGIDVGGTFTDLVLHDSERGITHTGKLLTTTAVPTHAILVGLERILRESDTPMSCVSDIVHGTTLATNTLLERTGPRVGLITNAGFRDVLEMGRETRFDIEDLHARPAPVLVPRPRRLGVAGRIDARGVELAPLDTRGVSEAARCLVEEHAIETLAVGFLHSYANPMHELQARDIIREAYPDLLVTLSAEVAPESGEYERLTTACVNAYVQPVLHAHLTQLQAGLAALGYEGQLYIMLSSGGLTTVQHAQHFPVKLLESGPAAGAIAASFLARKAGESRVISFDMGGTTAKICVIDDGRPARTHTFEAGRVDRFKPGSGLPLRLTVVDMIEIGSGGGSIAAVDDLGLLTVGPRSAGSSPGPVAYGLGGQQATVTDSDLLLGYLDPQGFLGGEMQLAEADVEPAIEREIARPLALDPHSAASGIQDVLTENLASATRAHMADRGSDPAAYTLVAFGGAGPVHAYALAKRLKMRRILVPMGAGVTSALGFLIAAPQVDSARAYQVLLHAVDWQRVDAMFAEMEQDARLLLGAIAEDAATIELGRSADMRYAGQGYEIEVDLPHADLNGRQSQAIGEAFSEAYRSTFDRTIDGAPELVTLRSTAAGPEVDIALGHPSMQNHAERGSRRVRFLEFGDITTPVYDRFSLAPGVRIAGPAVIEEPHSSCSFGPDCMITVDHHLNLVADLVTPGGDPAASGEGPPVVTPRA